MNQTSKIKIKGYELQDLLGSKNSEVWLAFDKINSRDVIIKLTKNRRAAIREKDLLVEIDHPNIPKLLSTVEVDGNICLIIEHKTGQSLYKIFDKIDDIFRLKILEGVGSALHEIHEHGMWHGDVSAQNIIFDQNKQTPYLIDFSFEGKCTVGYFAPEDLEETPYHLGPATDVYRFTKLIEYLFPD